MLPDPSNVQDFATLVWGAVTSSNWRYVAALLVVAAVFFGGKLLSKKLPFFGTGKGKAVLALAFSLLGGLATAFASGRVPTVPEVFAALSVGFTAAGGWSTIKALLE